MRGIGWNFRPSVNGVIGMDPTDANVAVVSRDFGVFADYDAALKNNTFIDDERFLIDF